MKKSIKKISAALLAIILIVSSGLLTGCMALLSVRVTGVEWAAEELSLNLGERIELNRLITVRPSLANNRGFTVESSDESVVAIESQSGGGVVARYYAEAVGTGDAVLIVTTDDGHFTDTVTVAVSYAQPSGVAVHAPRDATVIDNTVIVNLQEDTSLAPLSFTATLNEGVDPQTEIEWSATDRPTEYIPQDGAYTYTPAGVGTAEVTAAVTDENGVRYADTLPVAVYTGLHNVTAAWTSGNLVQDPGRYQTVNFVADWELPSGNPEPVVQWFVNDTAYNGGAEFAFSPSEPGLYTVRASVNGVTAEAGVVTVRGVINPKNVWVDYDNCYPNVFIRWDSNSAAGYEVSLVDLATGREVSSDLSTRNTALRNSFTDSGFDATPYMTGAENIFNTRFGVRVRTLGDDDGLLRDSEFSAEVRTELVPSEAKSYLEDTFYDGARNRYVRSYEEFYEWFEYAMLWRPSTLDRGEKLYLDYSFTSASKEIERAMNQMHFTGSYTYQGSSDSKNKKECTFKIGFESDGTPTLKTKRHSGESWDAMRPHINYDAQKARPTRYVFPIDARTPVTVHASDQLYYMVQLGYKPVPASGSAAERLYNYARRLMRYIVTDDMTDAQKIHAIYDWIMWRVVYDNEVLRITALESSVRYESYYMESVFTDTDYFGVCDAMSKAFVLLCGIEGIESVRVTGEAVSGGTSGGHAWNKVKLDDEWYVVDCTWGDVSVQVLPYGDARESAGHMYLLVTDEEIADTHAEDEGGSFPATASQRYPWYEERQGEDAPDLYIAGTTSTVAMQREVDELAEYMVNGLEGLEPVYRVGPDVINQSNSPYYCYEFVADARWGNAENSLLRRALSGSLQKRGYRQGADYFVVTGEIGTESHIMVFFVL